MAIFKKRGKWWISYRGADGKRHREPAAHSYALSKEILAKRENSTAEQKNFPERVTNTKSFEAVSAKFWSLHGPRLRSKSWGHMIKHLVEEFGSKKVGTITGADIQSYYNKVAARSSNSTANRHLTLIRCVFNKAKSWGDFYGENPCATVSKQREAAHRLRYLSTEEMENLLSAAHPRLKPLLICALLTGMRRGEILSLQWENVDLQKNVLYILQSKSGKPREIPITRKLHEEFLEIGPVECGRVFNLPVIMLRRYFEKALTEAHITGFRFHDLRHTFASHFIMKTCDLPSLQNILGHSSPSLTLRYAHLSQGHLASNMAAFESAIPTEIVRNGAEWHQVRHQQENAHSQIL